jgi:hypothetical protein
MEGWQRYALIGAAIYLVLWMGGNYSFQYTHQCVRSHTEERYNANADDTETVTVCDYYSANGRQWGFWSPLAAIRESWLTSWIDAAVYGALAAIAASVIVRSRRRTRREQQALWQYYREQHDSEDK